MKPNSISGITCHVADLAKTAEFYEALGFRRGKDEEDRVTFYVNWFFMTFVAQDRAAAAGEGMLVNIKVDDIEDFHASALEAGMKPDSEPEKAPSGNREFVLRDPDGYQLVFFQKR